MDANIVYLLPVKILESFLFKLFILSVDEIGYYAYGYKDKLAKQKRLQIILVFTLLQ